MTTTQRRYVFIDFTTLKKIKFRKLQKVCDKLFVLVSPDSRKVPLKLVMQTQKLGNRVKWTVANIPKEGQGFEMHVAFLMGQLHQKVSNEIEFAVLSDSENFDALIAFINENGRNCIRVRSNTSTKTTEGEQTATATSVNTGDYVVSSVSSYANDDDVLAETSTPHNGKVSEEMEALLVKTMDETVERLVRSGNRPLRLNVLKQYILLQNNNPLLQTHLDEVIEKMIEDSKIEVIENEVHYLF